jgi:hypothetical protein
VIAKRAEWMEAIYGRGGLNMIKTYNGAIGAVYQILNTNRHLFSRKNITNQVLVRLSELIVDNLGYKKPDTAKPVVSKCEGMEA